VRAACHTLRRLACRTLRRLAGWARRHRRALLVAALALVLLLACAPVAFGSDVYGNIGPAPQLPAGGLVERYPLSNYQLDEYFNGVEASLTGGIDVSGVPPLIAYMLAQVIWLYTAFMSRLLITLFSFAFSLDLINGNGTPGSGALTPVSQAIHSIYANTFGAPWLVVAIVLTGCWAMWKTLIQRRYTETASKLGLSLVYLMLALGIVTAPQATIGPASQLTNQLSTAFLSVTSKGTLTGEGEAKQAASDQLFELLIAQPWAVLEFGGIEHCVATPIAGKPKSVAVRPLSSNPSMDAKLAEQLENGTEVSAEHKICVNDLHKYAPHFLAYPFQSSERNAEHAALEHGDTSDLPNSDPSKTNGSYPLGPADEPAAEAMGKGGQYQRLLLSFVIVLCADGALLLLGALCLGVIVSQILFLLLLAFAPVALVIGVFPGRGHDFFTGWLTRLAGFLLRKATYSLILAVVLAVCRALAEATSNLGWLLSFVLQAAFLWATFLYRNKLTGDLLAATTGARTGEGDRLGLLPALYLATRLTGIANGRHSPATSPPPRPGRTDTKPGAPPPIPKTKTPANTPSPSQAGES
jgi:hypothetical protein